MGVTVSPIADGQVVTVEGVGLDGLREPTDVLDCGNSGTTMRLMLGLLAGRAGRHFVLTGDASLRSRPMRRVGAPLAQMGARIQGREDGNLAPLAVQGRPLHGGRVETAVASAQVKSALLLAALTAEGPTTVIEPAQSRDHSERMLRAFGADLVVAGPGGTEVTVTPGAPLTGQEVIVPGDISSAAFWLVAAAITLVASGDLPMALVQSLGRVLAGFGIALPLVFKRVWNSLVRSLRCQRPRLRCCLRRTSWGWTWAGPRSP
jgi:3-phosphoshikimate 1-carboxyvinyltransferase